MPQNFLNCINGGGRVRTKRISKDKYIKICYLNGKSYSGEVHEYKKIFKRK